MHLRSTKRALSILLIAVIIAMGLAPAALASVAAKVNTSSARVFKSASTKAQSMKVPKNLKVSVTSISGNWAKVSYKGRTAYMPLQCLTPTSKSKGYATCNATVYDSSGRKMCGVSKGASVCVLGTVSGGYCVTNSSGKIGFMKSGTLSPNKPTVSNVKKKTTTLSRTDKAIQTGQSLLGRRYATNANPPSTFNCSTFVKYCMGKAGYSMKGTAAAQAADGRYKKITSLSSARKGDVLFFDTTGNGQVDHAAIYLGGGKFIEASRNAGKVQVNTLDNWYKQHFKCARRPG